LLLLLLLLLLMGCKEMGRRSMSAAEQPSS
jgi:hypothetical protein